MDKGVYNDYAPMNVHIRPSANSDLPAYTKLLQRVYAGAYTDKSLGLTPECFSMGVFSTPNTQEYLASNLANNEKQKTWLAFDGDNLAGAITITNRGGECELRGFYVDVPLQGKGIGGILFAKARGFAGRKDIVLDIYAHNKKTIALYEKWGFTIDTAKGEFYRHWPEWPENVRARSIYMRLKGKG